MSPSTAEDGDVRLHLRIGGQERTISISATHIALFRSVAGRILTEPFRPRAWKELAFFLLSGALSAAVITFLILMMTTGLVLAVTFVGLVIIATAVRASRGFATWQRRLSRGLLDEHVPSPDRFTARPGFFGWLAGALKDRAGWRSLAYSVIKVPLVVFGVLFALSFWYDAIVGVTYPFSRMGGHLPGAFGFPELVFGSPGYGPFESFGHAVLVFCCGVVLFFAAPWPMRGVVNLDRWFQRALLGPDPQSARIRSLEQSRTQTVESSAATLRRIERDLHDGTQAQLVALAMRLGQAKEELASAESTDLSEVRRLVEEAHRGAKEAIVELRDLARGIHPPVLDTGLASALTTLAARSPVPTEVSFSIDDRPSPAIEAIAYFCVAELLANVAQHARASRASISCAEFASWLRIVVRDDGRGGALVSRIGSSSSGLAGLVDRVQAVDGHLEVVSPAGGPTVVTVDLPRRA